MASFASSATTGGARKHAWTKIKETVCLPSLSELEVLFFFHLQLQTSELSLHPRCPKSVHRKTLVQGLAQYHINDNQEKRTTGAKGSYFRTHFYYLPSPTIIFTIYHHPLSFLLSIIYYLSSPTIIYHSIVFCFPHL